MHLNKNIKNILDSLNSGKLSSDEISRLCDNIKDIEKELEAKSRELMIERALDCVRAVAMKMKKPEDMLDVCRMISDQLISLGIRNIRNVQTAIFDEAKHSYINFVYFLLDNETSIYEVDYEAQPDVSAFAHKMLDGPDEFFTTSFDNTKIREYLEYQKNAGQYVDEHLRNSKSLNFYFYSLGTGALGFSTYHPLDEDEVGLFKRFRNVFELAYRRFTDLTQARNDLKLLKEEKSRSESLLLNILPEEIAAELKQFGRSYARNHEEVTILYADIKGFTAIAETLSAQELVTQLDECFRAFDKLVDKHGLEKIRTIGDAYVCACGLPKPVPDNAVRTVRAALDMITFIKGFAMTRQIQDLPAFEFRVGIHTGPVITGVVGLKKFTYDIWGDSVTMAARMEQHGEAGKINISGSTYQLVKDKFKCVHRGKIEAKNKGEVDMYFVEG